MSDEPTLPFIVAHLAMTLAALPGDGFRTVSATYPLPVEVEGWDARDAVVTVTVSVGREASES